MTNLEELRSKRASLKEDTDRLFSATDKVIGESQRVGLGIDAGNLDRDVVDVWLFQCLNRVVITLVGLFVS